jgi:hypothetical protein
VDEQDHLQTNIAHARFYYCIQSHVALFARQLKGDFGGIAKRINIKEEGENGGI